MNLNRIGLTLLAGLACAAACSSQPDSPTADTGLKQWSGQYGGDNQPTTQVLHTSAEWEAFWRKVAREVPRPLNPQREMGVAISLGEKRTGGFAAEILRTGVEGGQLIVEYRESAPAPDMMVSQALTEPWAVAIAPRTDLPVVFRKVPAPPAKRPAK